MILKELIIFAPALPAVLCSFFFIKSACREVQVEKESMVSIAFAMILLLACITSTACIAFAWQTSHAYGVIQAMLSYLPFGVGIISLLTKHTDGSISNFFNEIAGNVVVPSTYISLVSIAIAVPVSVIPQYRQIFLSPPQAEVLSTSFLADSLDKIGKSFQEVEKKIKDERGILESSIQKLLSDFEKGKKDLEKVSEQQKQLQDKVEYYEQMASVTKPQAQALESMMRRSKYVDYFVGFLIGCASSVTAVMLSKVGPQLLRKQKNEIERNGKNINADN